MKSRILAWLSAFFTLVALGSSALADEGLPANRPRDVPSLTAAVATPPLPADFETQRVGDWLTLSFPRGMGDRMAPLADDAEAFKAELSSRLAQPLLSHVELRLARSLEEMATLAPKDSPPPTYAVGVAYPSLALIILSNVEPKTYEGTNLVEVFRHELVHVAIADALANRHVPLWFNEGVSIFFSGENAWDRLNTLRDASLSGTLLPLAQLDRNFPPEGVNVAYAESADFVRFLMRDQDRGRFAGLVSRVRDGQAFDAALADAYGSDTRRLEYQWQDDLSHRFSIWPAIVGGSALWVVAIGVLVVAYVRRKRKARAKLAQWAEEEAAADRFRDELVARAKLADEPQALMPTRFPEAPPITLQEGSWHTLH